jgi:hypothetical protein
VSVGRLSVSVGRMVAERPIDMTCEVIVWLRTTSCILLGPTVEENNLPV